MSELLVLSACLVGLALCFFYILLVPPKCQHGCAVCRAEELRRVEKRLMAEHKSGLHFGAWREESCPLCR